MPDCGGCIGSSINSKLGSAAAMRFEAMLAQRLASIFHSAANFWLGAESAMSLHNAACAL